MGENIAMLLYGFGGHGRVVADAIKDSGGVVSGIFDDRPIHNCPYPFLGPYSSEENPGIPILLTIGDNATRRRLAEKISHPVGTIIHPSAQLSQQLQLGSGSMVLQRSILQTGVQLGHHCIINSGVIVEHDCLLLDFVHLAPGAILCGGVIVGEGTFIGAGAVVLPGIKIGNNCVIGAGSVVTKSVPDGRKVAGNPARLL